MSKECCMYGDPEKLIKEADEATIGDKLNQLGLKLDAIYAYITHLDNIDE